MRIYVMLRCLWVSNLQALKDIVNTLIIPEYRYQGRCRRGKDSSQLDAHILHGWIYLRINSSQGSYEDLVQDGSAMVSEVLVTFDQH
jgi:hypothetical protein